jgi:carboxypeptidase C (cathepsin A)
MRFVALLALVVAGDAAITGDEVTSLPGWAEALPSKSYSGYLAVGPQKNRHLHYYFTLSENDPAKDPVTLWLNGGPGASSIAYGMMTEIGQLVMNRDSAPTAGGTPTLQYNPFSWTRKSNMLYIESPAGVGFSHCDYEPCHSNDTSTALDAYDALVAFFTGFKEFAGHEFYITGESYGMFGFFFMMPAAHWLLHRWHLLPDAR